MLYSGLPQFELRVMGVETLRKILGTHFVNGKGHLKKKPQVIRPEEN